jgi:Gas vesicle protein G
MGLVSGLLTLPLAPLRGTIVLAELIKQQAEREFYDSGNIRRQLEDVDRMRAASALSEAEAEAIENELVERLMMGQRRTDLWEG